MVKVLRYCVFAVFCLAVFGTGAQASRPASLAPQAGTYYVSAAAGSDVTGDGSSGSPWQTVTHALSQVSGPDVQVHVAAGMYDESLGESFPITMKPGVSLIGAGYETTILSGNGSADVLYFSSTEAFSETTTVGGFKVTNGSNGIHIEGTTGDGSSPTIQGNWITGNDRGLYIYGDYERNSHAAILNNIVSNNTGQGIGANADYGGSNISLHIEGNRIVDNGNHGIWFSTESYWANPSYIAPQVVDNYIAGNGRSGVHCTSIYAGYCNLQLVGNTVADNDEWGYSRSHSGSSLVASEPKFVSNLVYGNASGGIQILTYGVSSDQATFVNNTVAHNNAYGIHGGEPTIVNCIVWGHDDDLDAPVGSVSYSDIGEADYAGTNNNISEDPQFVDGEGHDYHILLSSPAVDAADDSHPDLPATDFEGDPRPLGDGFDMGADEVFVYLHASSKLAPALASPGQTITYTIALRNTGLAASGVWMTDTLSTLATYVPGSLSATSGDAGFSSGVITWTGSISFTAPVTLTFAVTTSAALPDSVLTNTAVITHPLTVSEHTMAVTTTLRRVILYTSWKDVTPTSIKPAEMVTYTLTVSNTGIDTANASLTDTIPAALVYVPGSLVVSAGSAAIDGQTLTWSGSLDPGTSAQVTFRAEATGPVSNGDLVVNTALVDDGVHEPFEIAAPAVLISVPLRSVYHVNAATGSDISGDGSPESPWRTITHALDWIANSEVELHVAPGTYDESLGESFPITMRPGISLVGAGYETTILSGNGSDNVIYFPSTEVFTETTWVSGFKITNGSAGVYVEGTPGDGSSPVIRGNWITENSRGVYNSVDAGNRTYTVISGNIISANASTGIYNKADGSGAHASPHIEGNQIVNNRHDGIHCHPSASFPYHAYCSPVVKDNVISGNWGAGIQCQTYSSGACNMEVVGNLITDNHEDGVSRTHGGSISYANASTFFNNVIARNGGGGAFFQPLDEPVFVNNTIVDNNYHGIQGGIPTIVNCIVWGNTDDLDAPVNDVSYSDIEEAGYAGTNNNISEDPQLMDPAHDDYHILPTSPAVDAGNSAYPNLPAFDFEGDPRVVDAAADIGADEVSINLRSSSKLAPAFATPGQTITYTIALRNTGLAASGIWMTDTLPTLATYVPGSLSATSGDAGFSSGVITWTGSISFTAPVTLTFAVTTSAALPDSVLTNTAVITHPLLLSEYAMTATTTLRRVNLHASYKAVTPAQITVGEMVTYTLVVSNTGLEAVSASLTDTMPAGLVYVPGSLVADTGSFGADGQTITWSGALNPGESARIQFCAIGGGVPSDGAGVVNTAFVDDGVHEPFGVSAPAVLVSYSRSYLPLLFYRHCPDFFDDFSNPGSGWPVGEDGYVRSEYVNGEYRVLSKKGGYLYLFRAPTCSRASYTVELDARWSGTPGNSYGILFGIYDDFSNYYLFDMNTDYRQFRLYRRRPSGFTQIVPPTYSSAINGGTASNHLQVIRSISEVTLVINGTTLGTWYIGNAGGFTEVGLIASAYSGSSSDARFDNFSVVGLAEGGASGGLDQSASGSCGPLELQGFDLIPADVDGWSETDGLSEGGVRVWPVAALTWGLGLVCFAGVLINRRWRNG